MSENVHHEASPTGPIRTPKQLLVASAYAFVVPVFIIIGLVMVVGSQYKPQAGSSDPAVSIESRLARIGHVEIRDANRPLEAGSFVYEAQCATCHTAGVAGAPKLGDAGEWAGRLPSGFDALVHSALEGKGAMAPQGGGAFRDLEIARAVAYMINAAGGSAEEPDDPGLAEAATTND